MRWAGFGSRPGSRQVHLGVERGRIARQAERPARAREMRVDEEEAEPRVGQVLLDAAPHRASGAVGQGAHGPRGR